MTTHRPLRIAIVNDYEVVVMGLARMLEPYPDRVQVVELAANAVVTDPVDIVLYDTFSQLQDGARDVEALLAGANAGRLVVYSWNLQPELAASSLRNGATAHLGKRLSPTALIDALERVHAGEPMITESGPEPDVEPHVEPGDWPGRAQGLTAREAEIISLITQGLSNQEIAERAYLSINTVKSYIRSSYRKMSVTSRSRAVLWGLDHGFRPDHVWIRRPVGGGAR